MKSYDQWIMENSPESNNQNTVQSRAMPEPQQIDDPKQELIQWFEKTSGMPIDKLNMELSDFIAKFKMETFNALKKYDLINIEDKVNGGRHTKWITFNHNSLSTAEPYQEKPENFKREKIKQSVNAHFDPIEKAMTSLSENPKFKYLSQKNPDLNAKFKEIFGDINYLKNAIMVALDPRSNKELKNNEGDPNAEPTKKYLARNGNYLKSHQQWLADQDDIVNNEKM